MVRGVSGCHLLRAARGARSELEDDPVLLEPDHEVCLGPEPDLATGLVLHVNVLTDEPGNLLVSQEHLARAYLLVEHDLLAGHALLGVEKDLVDLPLSHKEEHIMAARVRDLQLSRIELGSSPVVHLLIRTHRNRSRRAWHRRDRDNQKQRKHRQKLETLHGKFLPWCHVTPFLLEWRNATQVTMSKSVSYIFIKFNTTLILIFKYATLCT